jgi:hypothetical protein
MSIGSTLQALMKAAQVVLAAVVLVGAPMAEAAICAGEDLSLNVQADATPPELVGADVETTPGGADHDSKLPGEDQHCVHGHCHHLTPFKSDDATAPAPMASDAAATPITKIADLAHVSAGLERPPKA